MARIITKRRKSKSRKTPKRVKSKRKTSKRTVAKRKKSRRKKSSSGSGIGIIGKVPVVGKVLRDPRVKKAAMAAGIASIGVGLVKLVPVPQVQALANNPLAEPIVAGLVDPLGGAIRFVQQGGAGILRAPGQPSALDVGGMA